MEKNKVFVKTAEGEEAVRQRTRLVQRNLRSILIMVDGHATVAELARRFGDENAAQAALAELRSGGFIVEAANPLDFTAMQPPEAAGEKAEEAPVLAEQAVETGPAAPASSPPVIEDSLPPAPEPPPVASLRREPKPAPPGAGWIDRIKTLFAVKPGKPAAGAPQARRKDYEDSQTIGPIDLEPIRRGPRFFFAWPVLALLAMFAVAVLLALTLLLYPYGRHLPDIERNASAMMQDPVTVGDIGFSFLPRPHIALRDVTVGREAHLSIATVQAVPDYLSLFGNRKVFHELVFDRSVVKASGLGRLAMAGAASGGAGAVVRHITLNELSLAVGGALVGGLSGEVGMSGNGSPEGILLRNAEGTLKLELQPQNEGYRIAASGSNWKTPFKPSLTFQTIEMQGELRASRLDVIKLDGQAYEGLIEGKASLDWAGPAVFAGNLELKRLNAAKLLSTLGSELAADGELSARLRLDARAESPQGLAEALRAEATFEIARGGARGFDLGEAVRSTGREPTRGGETRFEQMTGTLQVDPQESRLGNLRLGSGLLRVGGNLVIAGNAQLSGTLDVELKGSAATQRIQLAIGGTTKDPLLKPARAR